MRHYIENGRRYVNRGLGFVPDGASGGVGDVRGEGLGITKQRYNARPPSQVTRYNIVSGGNCLNDTEIDVQIGQIPSGYIGPQERMATQMFGTSSYLTFDQLSQMSTPDPIPVRESQGGTGAMGWVLAKASGVTTVGYVSGKKCQKVVLSSSTFYVATPDGGLVQVPAGSYSPGMIWSDLVQGGAISESAAPAVSVAAPLTQAGALVQMCQSWWSLYAPMMAGINSSLQNPPLGNGLQVTASTIGQIAMGLAPSVGWPSQATFQGLITSIPGYPFRDQALVTQFVNGVIACAQSHGQTGVCPSGYKWDPVTMACVPGCPTTGNAAWLPPDQASTLVCDTGEQVFTDRHTGCVTCVPKSNCWAPGSAPLPCQDPLIVSPQGKYVCCIQSGATYTRNPYTGAQPGGAGPLPLGPPPGAPPPPPPTSAPPPPPSPGILDTLKAPENRNYVIGGAVALGALILMSVMKGKGGGGGGGRAKEGMLARGSYFGVREV